MMINSKVYKGIEYIQLSELPQSQRESILQSINHELFIKIMIDGKIVDHCLQYKDYCLWFKNSYQVKTTSPKKDEVVKGKETIEFKPDLAFK
jgi:hypothetical protein